MSAAALEVAHLSVRFDRTTVLRDLSFQVPRGSSFAIIGPNGAGKTVLFRTLIGALPFEGRIAWAPDTRLGYVPQKLDLARDVPLTGFDLLGARAALGAPGRRTPAEWLHLVGIPRDAARQPIGALSGGQFQRLLVALALIGEPNVLLLDEPTAGVDEPGQEQLNELVERLRREEGLTVLFISHELSVVFRYATDVLCLGRERMWVGPPKTILTPELLREMYGAPVGFHVHDA